MVDSPLVQRELDVAATNANTAIDHLAEKGILTKGSGVTSFITPLRR